MRENKITRIKNFAPVNSSYTDMTNHIASFADEEGITLQDINISSSDLVTATNSGGDEQVAIFDGNSKKIKGGSTITEIKANIPLTILSSTESFYADPYIVQDNDIMIIVTTAAQIILPAINCCSGRQIIFKNQSQVPIIINALSTDNIDGASNITLQNNDHVHLIASNSNNAWNIIASSLENSIGTVTSVGITNTDGNLVITDTPITSSGDIQVNLSQNINVKSIVCNDIGNIKYLESKSVISQGQVVADYFLTEGGVGAKGTIQGGTLVSQGDITSYSDINTVRLNFNNDTSRLTLAQNIAQKKKVTLVFPPNAGKINQVLSTDGNGNLRWVDNNIIIVDSIGGKNILNGTSGVVINTSAVTIKSIISVTRNIGHYLPESVITIGNLIVGSIIDHESFTIYSTVVDDTGSVDWLVLNP